jgi:hypothetical protein
MVSRRHATAVLGVLALPPCRTDASSNSAWTIDWRDESTPVLDFAVSRDGVPWAIVASGQNPTLLYRGRGRWEQRGLPAGAVSVFPLIEGFCWLVTASGIWRSLDGGTQWAQQWKGEGIQRVFFLDEQLGYAVGSNKTVLVTADGGQHWEPLEAASAPRTTPEYTTYSWVEFGTRRAGIITGWSRPPRAGITDMMPAWRDPARDSRRPEWPGASLTLETRDGGVTWKHSSVSLFGRISRVRYARGGRGLSLVEFHDAFEFPSEVYAIDLRTGKSERVYRDKERAVTDIALTASGLGVLAAVDVPADPGKDDQGQVRLLGSEDLRAWKEELLPEKLSARRVWVAGHRPDALWAAADTGVILARKG